MIITLALTGQAIGHANAGKDPAGIWKPKILDSGAAATLVIGLLAASIVRRQVALSVRPYVVYEGLLVDKSELGVVASKAVRLMSHDDSDATAPRSYWTTTAYNIGPGIALIREVHFDVTLRDEETTRIVGSNLPGIERELEHHGIRCAGGGPDLWLVALSHGSAIGTGVDKPLCEMNIATVGRIERLDITLDFEGLLGDAYRKRVFCIPRSRVLRP